MKEDATEKDIVRERISYFRGMNQGITKVCIVFICFSESDVCSCHLALYYIKDKVCFLTK